MTEAAHIRAFGSRIERLDAEIAEINAGKKEIYAEMRGAGHDVKAFKKAHRRHLSHEKNAASASEADFLEDKYFLVLQGQEGAETQSGANVVAGNSLPANPSRVRAREGDELTEIKQPDQASVGASKASLAGGGDAASHCAPPADLLPTPHNVPPVSRAMQDTDGDSSPPADEAPSVSEFISEVKSTADTTLEFPNMPDFLKRDGLERGAALLGAG